MIRHRIVTRFSVPLAADRRAESSHDDPAWLASRLELFHRFYARSVGRLGIPSILLCSSASAPWVADATRGLDWLRVVEQNDWRGGYAGSPDEVLTRLDSDDAVHEGWFRAVEGASPAAEVVCTKRFLRLDDRSRKVFRYRRLRPSPLAAFRGGANPYAHDHEELERCYRVVCLRKPYLLQVAHGGNLSTRYPKWLRPRAAARQLAAFGLDP